MTIKKLITMTVFMVGCSVDHNFKNSRHDQVISIENPIIVFCERLHPEILYPDAYERETLIVECMEICTEEDNCAIAIPDTILEDL